METPRFSLTRTEAPQRSSATPSARSIPVLPLPSSPRDVHVESTMELVARARNGSEDAVEAICVRCVKGLRRFAAGRLPPRARGMEDTQDLVWKAVEKGMQRLDTFEARHPGALLAYMRTILKNLVIDAVRKANRAPKPVSLEDEHMDDTRSPLERVLNKEQIELYEAALERLKPRDQELIHLKLERQATDEQIALQAGIPTKNAARVAVKRALFRLAHEMSRLSVGVPPVPAS
jgi:RNA polymerase sigma factor (sigma-70 family)